MPPEVNPHAFSALTQAAILRRQAIKLARTFRISLSSAWEKFSASRRTAHRDFTFTSNAQISFKSRAASGAFSVGTAQAIKFGVQFASAIVLSRMLAPADFGVVAMVAPLLALVGLLQDLGLSQAAIQRPELTHTQASTLFWINVAAAVACAFAILAMAPLVANFYGFAQLSTLTAAYAALVAIGGLTAQHNALLNREMMFGALAISDAGSAIVGFLATVAAALVAPNYWALFVGSAASTLFALIAAWAPLGWIPSRPRFGPELRSFLGYGAGVTGFNFVNYLARNLDNVLIGRAFGDIALGYYDRAYKLLLLPLQQINAPLGRVLLPALSRLVPDTERYRFAYLRSVRLSLLVALPAVVLLSACSDVAIPLVLGDQWRETAKIFAWLGIAGLVQPLNNLSGLLYLSQGRTREMAIYGALLALFPTCAFFIGLPFGVTGVAAAYAFAELVKTPLVWSAATRHGPVRLRDIFLAAGPNALGAAASFCALLLLRQSAPQGTWTTIFAGFALSYVSTIAVLICFASGRSTLADARDLLTSGAAALVNRSTALIRRRLGH